MALLLQSGRFEIGEAAPHAASIPTGLRIEFVHVYVCVLNVGVLLVSLYGIYSCPFRYLVLSSITAIHSNTVN